MKDYFITILMVLTLMAFSGAQVLAQPGAHLSCPVMRGEPVKEKFFADYQEKRIYFCCKNCVRKFKHHPEKYAKNLGEN